MPPDSETTEVQPASAPVTPKKSNWWVLPTACCGIIIVLFGALVVYEILKFPIASLIDNKVNNNSATNVQPTNNNDSTSVEINSVKPIKVAPTGIATINELLDSPAGTQYQIYPNEIVSQSEDNYSSLSPVLPKDYFEPGNSSSILAFNTSSWSQKDLVDRCYDTWAVPATNGGKLCGTDTVDGDPGQCTFWALLNFDNPDVYKLNRPERVDARQFIDIAKDKGVATSQTPNVGAIVVWDYTPGQYGTTGHMAVVVGVNQQKHTFVVSEMNNESTPWRIDYRVISSDPGGVGHDILLGFILPSKDVQPNY